MSERPQKRRGPIGWLSNLISADPIIIIPLCWIVLALALFAGIAWLHITEPP